MNTTAMILTGMILTATAQGLAQEADGSSSRRGTRAQPPPQEQATLTEAQQAQVKAILAKYDPATLTAEQAKAIHEAFRQAGVRGGPAMGEAIRAAGFDPEKLRDLAPPPGRAGAQGGRNSEASRPEPPADNDEPPAAAAKGNASAAIPAATPAATTVTPETRQADAAPAATGFALRSPEVQDGGALPVAYTGDGEGATLPLAWIGAPAGTKEFTLIMHHLDPQGKTKWYWTLYHIPADTLSLPRNVKNVGTLGSNSVNGQAAYAPPHSKGPGAKSYTLTVYALSAPVAPGTAPSEVTRDSLLAAMQGKILATADMQVVYTR